MTRTEIQTELKKLGFKRLCDDNKTLVAYNEIQHMLKANRTPLKAITKIFLWGHSKQIHVDLTYGFDAEIGYSYYDEM